MEILVVRGYKNVLLKYISPHKYMYQSNYRLCGLSSTVKLGNKERFDKEQIGIKEPFPVTNLPFTS